MYGLYLHRIRQISEEHSPYVCAGQNTFYISIYKCLLCVDTPSQDHPSVQTYLHKKVQLSQLTEVSLWNAINFSLHREIAHSVLHPGLQMKYLNLVFCELGSLSNTLRKRGCHHSFYSSEKNILFTHPRYLKIHHILNMECLNLQCKKKQSLQATKIIYTCHSGCHFETLEKHLLYHMRFYYSL